MLSISTIPEALAELEKQTGRTWTDSELFDVATKHGIELHAAAPIAAQVIVQEFVIGKGLQNKFNGMPIRNGGLAVLFPWQVGQVWVSGETLTRHPSNFDEVEGEYRFFLDYVRVTREQVRIKSDTLKKILTIWKNAQAGRWIKDDSAPRGMRYQIGPDWMFPQPLEAPVETPVAPPEVVKRGITKQRVIAAFEGLHFNAAQWSKALADVPKWLESSRVMKGNKRTSALWNPVQIAIALYDKDISIKKLDAVFVGLSDWIDEWQAARDYCRD